MKALLEQSTILASADIKAKSLYGGIILALCYWLFWKAGLSRKLPPSPPSGLFHLFGHARIVFSRLPAQRYAALTKELGEPDFIFMSGQYIYICIRKYHLSLGIWEANNRHQLNRRRS